MAGSGTDAQSLNAPFHRQQYVDFRVVVYRLNIAGMATFSAGRAEGSLPFDTIFNADFGDIAYEQVSYFLNGPNAGSNFSDFLTQYYGAMQQQLLQSAPGAPSAYQEIDITPLVQSVTNHIGLYDMNHASMSLMDAGVSAFTDVELRRFSSVNRYTQPQLEQLTSFRLREFDLVRVFAYSGIDVPPANRMESLSTYFAGGLNAQFLLSPVFTGVVNKINRGNDVGGVAFMNVDMLGIERIFAQSTTVVDAALADQVQGSLPTIPSLENTFSAMEPRFSNQNADEIIIGIFSTYLAPSFLIDDNGSFLMGVPDIAYVFANKLFDKGQARTAKLIPMIPTIILIHMMKKKYGEPILRFDDRVETNIVEVSGRPGVAAVATSALLRDAMLEPYLLRFRQAFALYSGQYESAASIFDTIKQNTYMEIFEDRTGEFHFRFPRYNAINLMVYIDPKDVISVSHEKNDSAIFTAETVQQVLPGYGNLTAVPQRVYVDKLSILKFGLRKPQTVENPNAISTEFADALAQFARDYFSMRDSRVAVVNKIGDPTINVGQMALFKIRKDTGLNSKPVVEDVLAGYITTIDEVFAVGGQYTQSLGMAFVRPAAQTVSVRGGTSIGTSWDVVNCMPDSVSSASQVGMSIISPETLSGLQLDPKDSSPFLFEMSYGNRSVTGATFRHITNPMYLASVAAKSSELIAASALAALAAGKQDQVSMASLQIAMKAQNSNILSIEADMATRVVINHVLNTFLNFPSGIPGYSSPGSFSQSIGPIATADGHAHITFADLKVFGSQMSRAYISSQKRYSYAAAISATYSSVSVSGVSLSAVTLDPRDVELSTSWASLIKSVSDMYTTSGFQGNGPSFAAKWELYFNNGSSSELSTTDLTNANDLLAKFSMFVTRMIDANDAIISDRDGVLLNAVSERQKLTSAIKNFSPADRNRAAQSPASIYPIGAGPLVALPNDTAAPNAKYLEY